MSFLSYVTVGKALAEKTSQVNFIYIARLKTTAVDPKCFPEIPTTVVKTCNIARKNTKQRKKKQTFYNKVRKHNLKPH